MNENFIVQINEDLVNSLIIHTNVAAQLKLKHNDIKKLKFGLKSLGVKINISMQIKENVLELSKGIVNSLKLPLSSTYQLTLRNDEIIIGPFIGILFAKSQTTFAKKFPQLVDYVHDYSSFGGTIGVDWPAARRMRAASNAFLRSATPEKTALICWN